MTDLQFDVVVVGSGFGGSVSAMRLTRKGYRVAVLEKGRRFNTGDFPKSNWNLRKFFWAPLFRCFGFQGVRILKGLMVLHGVGVGGGSLVYANTLMKPLKPVFDDPAWPGGHDWEKELEPSYAEARRMLGVTTNRHFDSADLALREVGKSLGCEESFHGTEVGVFFGEPGRTVKDPYFGGEGPERTGCIFCGGCMVGCRYGAKNTLDRNYLYLAEKSGARIFPDTEVTRILPVEGGYELKTSAPSAWLRSETRVFRASRVVLAAGVLGTLELLLRSRDRHGTLPNLSPALGVGVRTNGESLVGVTTTEKTRDFSKGIAIGAAIHPDPTTKIEAVRYPSGSGAMKMLSVPLTPDGSRLTRPLKMLGVLLARFPRWIRVIFAHDWASSSVILLVMRSIDEKLRLGISRHGNLTSSPEHGSLPSFLPVAQKAATELARDIHGEPQNAVSEVLLGAPATAHILGGCCLSDSPETGVVDASHEVFGHPGLYVCDGSVIPVNLGVNPSLTITALAERFASLWEPKSGS